VDAIAVCERGNQDRNKKIDTFQIFESNLFVKINNFFNKELKVNKKLIKYFLESVIYDNQDWQRLMFFFF